MIEDENSIKGHVFSIDFLLESKEKNIINVQEEKETNIDSRFVHWSMNYFLDNAQTMNILWHALTLLCVKKMLIQTAFSEILIKLNALILDVLNNFFFSFFMLSGNFYHRIFNRNITFLVDMLWMVVDT